MKTKIFKYVFFFIAFVMIIIAVVTVFINKENKKSSIENLNAKLNTNKEISIGILEFDTLNPILTNNIDIQYISKLIYKGLINVTKDFKIQNDLAEECSKINNTTYIIKLKQDAKWHNGELINAEDVKFTIENLNKINSIYKENVKHISNIEIIDDFTIKIYLDEEINFFEYMLTFPILSKNYYEENTLKSKTEIPVGSGNFNIRKITDNEISLENNENKINIKIYKNILELYESLKNENINLSYTNNIEYENFTGKLGINSNISSGREFDFIAFNNKNILLKNKEVRQAINYFIDKKNIIYEAFNNKYLQLNFPLNPENYLYKEENDVYDINKGKQVLLEKGWQIKNNIWQKRGTRLVFNLLVNINNKKRCEVAKIIKEQLEKNGIIINIIEANDYYYNQKIKYKNYDMILAGNILPLCPDINSYFGEDNICNYNNDEILYILNEIKNIENKELLKEKYYRIQEIYNEEIPFISLYINTNFILYNSKIKGDFLHNWYNLYYNIDNWYTID